MKQIFRLCRYHCAPTSLPACDRRPAACLLRGHICPCRHTTAGPSRGRASAALRAPPRERKGRGTLGNAKQVAGSMGPVGRRKARWTHRLIPNIKVWIERRHGELKYHLMQLLTGGMASLNTIADATTTIKALNARSAPHPSRMRSTCSITARGSAKKERDYTSCSTSYLCNKCPKGVFGHECAEKDMSVGHAGTMKLLSLLNAETTACVPSSRSRPNSARFTGYVPTARHRPISAWFAGYISEPLWPTSNSRLPAVHRDALHDIAARPLRTSRPTFNSDEGSLGRKTSPKVVYNAGTCRSRRTWPYLPLPTPPRPQQWTRTLPPTTEELACQRRATHPQLSVPVSRQPRLEASVSQKVVSNPRPRTTDRLKDYLVEHPRTRPLPRPAIPRCSAHRERKPRPERRPPRKTYVLPTYVRSAQREAELRQQQRRRR
ncbi:unnamed protein product [Trichogramma brassicae]|uniref:Uncharacterized protein n=1 Tax=Trichogramma brassicae TaxID=86971 RepID=A0A6H5I8Z4_9HYME|nr:unnamed protein product [Trichogramma brassicae]